MHATTRAIIGPRKRNLHSPYLCSFPVFQAIHLLLGRMEDLERVWRLLSSAPWRFIRAAFSRLGNCSMRFGLICRPLLRAAIWIADSSVSWWIYIVAMPSFNLQILHIIWLFFSIAFHLAFSQFLYFGQASWAIFLRMKLLRHWGNIKTRTTLKVMMIGLLQYLMMVSEGILDMRRVTDLFARRTISTKMASFDFTKTRISR